jgi:hypothetical protein
MESLLSFIFEMKFLIFPKLHTYVINKGFKVTSVLCGDISGGQPGSCWAIMKGILFVGQKGIIL